MDQTILIEKRVAPEPSTPSSHGDAGEYRYDSFRIGVVIDDFKFSQNSLKPGQVLPNRTLVRTDGERISLRDLSAGRPIVLVTGSVTCPLSISTLSLFGELNRLHGDRMAFAFIYTREAHPGENIQQPATMAVKIAHARLLMEIHGVDWPVLVDDLDGSVHRMLDTKQNSIHILDSDGTILFRALFAGDPAAEEAVQAIALSHGPRKPQALGRLAGPMKSIGYIEETLRHAGSRAVADVVKAVLPMAAMALIARAFPFLPKASRGWAAAGTLMVGATAIVVGISSGAIP